MPNNHVAVVKYIISAIASTIVVISGLAIIAGSTLSFLAIIGSIPPIIFAIITVKNTVKHTVMDRSSSVFSRKYSLIKFTEDKVSPTMKLT